MKSDIIMIDNQGNGFADALHEAKKTAEYKDLSKDSTIQLQLIAEEMLSLARSVTGEMKASFWLEAEGKTVVLNMTTKTVMDREKRDQLISSASSRKNEAANSFLGKLRNAFEQAMAGDSDRTTFELPDELVSDISNRFVESPEWDRYEQSILLKLADDVKIAIRGGLVNMTVTKAFAE